MGCPVADSCRGFGYDCLDCSGMLPLDEALSSTLPLLYRKISPTDINHPLVDAKAAQREEKKKAAKRQKQSEAWKAKSKLVKRAYKNERITRDTIIRATSRSGATNGDGDSRIGDGQWGIDDKLMTKSSQQFTIRVEDIDKASAQRCVIVVTLSTGKKFVIAELGDFCSASAAMAAACEKQSLHKS